MDHNETLLNSEDVAEVSEETIAEHTEDTDQDTGFVSDNVFQTILKVPLDILTVIVNAELSRIGIKYNPVEIFKLFIEFLDSCDPETLSCNKSILIQIAHLLMVYTANTNSASSISEELLELSDSDNFSNVWSCSEHDEDTVLIDIRNIVSYSIEYVLSDNVNDQYSADRYHSLLGHLFHLYRTPDITIVSRLTGLPLI